MRMSGEVWRCQWAVSSLGWLSFSVCMAFAGISGAIADSYEQLQRFSSVDSAHSFCILPGIHSSLDETMEQSGDLFNTRETMNYPIFLHSLEIGAPIPPTWIEASSWFQAKFTIDKD